MSVFPIGPRIVYGLGSPEVERQLWKERNRRMEEEAQRREIERKKKAADDAAAIKAFQKKGKGKS